MNLLFIISYYSMYVHKLNFEVYGTYNIVYVNLIILYGYYA